MATKKSSRQVRAPRRPLDDEFAWETLNSLSADLTNMATFPSPSLPTKADPQDFSPLVDSAAIPDRSQNVAKASSLPARENTGQQTRATTSKPEDIEYQKLLLDKQNRELDIQKLQLQLELTKLQASTGNPALGDFMQHPTGGRAQEQTKSLGDLRAPQRTLFPQQWPHILAPGEPKLYNELTLAEFSAGYLSIVHKCADSTQQSILSKHLEDIMILACTYQWSAVRAYHYKVLRALELGLVKWGDSFEAFKQPFFIPPNLLPSVGSQEKPLKPATSRFTGSQQPSISRNLICDEWSWYDNCDSEACSKLHICIVCKRPDHQAKTCPKRKFNIPPRRPDQATKST